MKTIIALFLIAIITVATFTIINDAKLKSEWAENREVITITVQMGDTIDGFWAEYAPNWMDRHEYRAEIMELNGLNTCSIYVGQTLKLYV